MARQFLKRPRPSSQVRQRWQKNSYKIGLFRGLLEEQVAAAAAA
jgi:hypothetical protein